MSETKFVRTQKNIGNDIWFQGKADKTAPELILILSASTWSGPTTTT